MKIKLKLVITIAILLMSLVLGEEYPYFFKIITGEISSETINEVNYYNLTDCLKWYDYCYYDAPQIKVDISPDNTLPGIISNDFENAASEAMTAWNDILSSEEPVPFIQEDSSVEKVWISLVENWSGDMSESGYVEYAVDTYNNNSITYYNSYYSIEPGEEYTIIYLNADSNVFFNWVIGEPQSGEVDVQHVLTHELGHVLGFDDDIIIMMEYKP